MGIAVTGDEVLGAIGMTAKHLKGSGTWLWHEPVLSFCQQKKKKTGKKSFKYLQTSTTTYFILCEIRSVLLSMKSAALCQGTRTEPAVGVKSGSCPDLQPYTGVSIQQRPSGVFGVVPPEPALLGKSLHQAHNCLLHPKHGTFHRVHQSLGFHFSTL